MTDLPRPYPWERQGNESPASFDAFRRYLQMGSARNIAAMGRDEGREFHALAAEHRWTARADAWDKHVLEIQNENAEDELAEMGRRHLAIVAGHFQVVEQELEKLKSRLATETLGVKRLNLKELAQTVDILVKIERLTRGQATDRTEDTSQDLSGLSVEQLEQLTQIRRAIEGKP